MENCESPLSHICMDTFIETSQLNANEKRRKEKNNRKNTVVFYFSLNCEEKDKDRVVGGSEKENE